VFWQVAYWLEPISGSILKPVRGFFSLKHVEVCAINCIYQKTVFHRPNMSQTNSGSLFINGNF
jgi:hypothetical protein